MEGDREGSALYIDSQFMPSKLGKIRSTYAVYAVTRLRSLTSLRHVDSEVT